MKTILEDESSLHSQYRNNRNCIIESAANDIIVSATASAIIFVRCSDLIVRSWKLRYIHTREQSLCTNAETSLRYISVARIKVNDCCIFGIQMDCISLKRSDRCWKLNTRFPAELLRKKKTPVPNRSDSILSRTRYKRSSEVSACIKLADRT